MFRLTRAAEYAIRGLIYLALQEGRVTSVEEIARANAISASYLAKIFQTLARRGIVRSLKGPSGGFLLATRPEDITILKIVEVVKGRIYLKECLLGYGYHCFRDCPIQEVCKEARLRLRESLESYTLEDLVAAFRDRDRT